MFTERVIPKSVEQGRGKTGTRRGVKWDKGWVKIGQGAGYNGHGSFRKL